MTDPAPEPIPAPPAPRKHNPWQRIRLYTWAIILVLTFWACGALVTFRLHPEWFLDKVLARLPFYTSHGQVSWLNRYSLQIRELNVGNFFYARAVVITATPWGLLAHHVQKIELKRCQLFTTPLSKVMAQTTGDSPGGLNWTIERLEITRGTLYLEDLAPEMPPVPVRIGVVLPFVLKNIRLNKPDDSPDMMAEQQIDIDNVFIVSPVDPLAPVLSFPLTRIRFTYAEIWKHHLREVIFIRPVIFLGQDLFWFANQFKGQRAQSAEQGLSAPWEVAHLEAQYGRLSLNAFGQEAVRLPFYFKVEVNDIRLDQLEKISAKSNIPILNLNLDYPDYKVRIDNLHGNLGFSLPPSDVHANNVVNTLKMDLLSWDDIAATEAWSSVTFDPTGIYGELGGKCEGGYIKGNFEIYYSQGFTWNADLFAQNINCQPVTQKLGGKYVNLTGLLNGKISVQGQATEILDCHGTLSLPKPGVLKIKSMDSLLKDLPVKLTLKDQALKLAVEAFRTYPYEKGELKIAYKPASGSGTLDLNSSRGNWHFGAYWHPMPEETSKVAKEADNR